MSFTGQQQGSAHSRLMLQPAREAHPVSGYWILTRRLLPPCGRPPSLVMRAVEHWHQELTIERDGAQVRNKHCKADGKRRQNLRMAMQVSEEGRTRHMGCTQQVKVVTGGGCCKPGYELLSGRAQSPWRRKW